MPRERTVATLIQKLQIALTHRTRGLAIDRQTPISSISDTKPSTTDRATQCHSSISSYTRASCARLSTVGSLLKKSCVVARRMACGRNICAPSAPPRPRRARSAQGRPLRLPNTSPSHAEPSALVAKLPTATRQPSVERRHSGEADLARQPGFRSPTDY